MIGSTASAQDLLAGGRAVVIGGGTMGAGIAQVLLAAGADVLLIEPSTPTADEARRSIERRLGPEASARLVVARAAAAITNAGLVIEAVPEDAELKRSLLASVESQVSASCLVVSNTSSLSIDGIAAGMEHPERFLGMHFFNPVPKNALVELVLGASTSDEALDRARAWVVVLGKEHIEVRDSPGFATSRLGVAIGLEAIRMVEEDVASIRDIDRGMEIGYRYPMGPLRLTDLVGLDIRLAVAEHLASMLGPRFDPPKLLREKVAAGELGRKSGKGFYEW